MCSPPPLSASRASGRRLAHWALSPPAGRGHTSLFCCPPPPSPHHFPAQIHQDSRRAGNTTSESRFRRRGEVDAQVTGPGRDAGSMRRSPESAPRDRSRLRAGLLSLLVRTLSLKHTSSSTKGGPSRRRRAPRLPAVLPCKALKNSLERIYSPVSAHGLLGHGHRCRASSCPAPGGPCAGPRGRRVRRKDTPAAWSWASALSGLSLQILTAGDVGSKEMRGSDVSWVPETR